MRVERAASSLFAAALVQEFNQAVARLSAQSRPTVAMPRDPGGTTDPGGRAAELIGNAFEMMIHHFTITVTEVDNRKIVTIQAGEGSDNIQVREDSDGTVVITNNGGQSFRLKGADGTEIVVKGGAGNDKIDATGTTTTANGTSYMLTLEGEADDDILLDGQGGDVLIGGAGRDTAVGNDGNDYIDGQRGADMLVGGEGKDVVYGGYGMDFVAGGEGDDYLDAGQSNDIAFGGAGADTVSGGRGDDSIDGGAGDDVLIASFGRDTLRGQAGWDKIYAKNGDLVAVDPTSQLYPVVLSAGGEPLGSSITVFGPQAFQDRMGADIDTLSGLPLGQQLLTSLDSSGHTTWIVPFDEQNGTAAPLTGKTGDTSPDKSGRPGAGADTLISINPSFRQMYSGVVSDEWATTPPIVVLFHEMGHAEDMTHGMLLPSGEISQNPGGLRPTARSAERSVVGLPYNQDDNPLTNEPNGRATTENNFREQLGLPARLFY
jgi:NleD-like pathogen effector protein (putative zinc metallopeptidase)/hemolysin type calcium-binding protein